jgi:energy-converting hydrogenase Eha subunit H
MRHLLSAIILIAGIIGLTSSSPFRAVKMKMEIRE